jgi:hypothetical protein
MSDEKDHRQAVADAAVTQWAPKVTQASAKPGPEQRSEARRMKTITVMRDGRPATAEELNCAVQGKPLPPLFGSPAKPEIAVVIDHGETGRRVREFRESLGVSLRRVAKHAGLSAMFISDLERGRRAWTKNRLDNMITNILEANRGHLVGCEEDDL